MTTITKTRIRYRPAPASEPFGVKFVRDLCDVTFAVFQLVFPKLSTLEHYTGTFGGDELPELDEAEAGENAMYGAL